MMRRIALLLTAGAAMTAAGCQTNEPAVVAPVAPVEPVAAVDMNSPLYAPMFLQMAASSNLWEIQSSQLAHQRVHTPALHQFVQMIINDHGQLHNQLQTAIQAAGLTPPPHTMLPEEQQMLAQLQATAPESFEPVYRDMQIQAHRKAIALFQNYAANGDNPTLRNAAAQALPVLQRHLQMAESVVLAPRPAMTSPGERG